MLNKYNHNELKEISVTWTDFQIILKDIYEFYEMSCRENKIKKLIVQTQNIRTYFFFLL